MVLGMLVLNLVAMYIHFWVHGQSNGLVSTVHLIVMCKGEVYGYSTVWQMPAKKIDSWRLRLECNLTPQHLIDGPEFQKVSKWAVVLYSCCG